MLRLPNCLCQTMAWAFPVCQVDAPEVTLSRSFQQRSKLNHLFMRHVVFFYGWGTIHRFPNRILSFKITRTFFFLNSRVFPPKSHSSLLFNLQALLLVSSATADASDVTFVPIAHIWAPKRPCRETPSN